MLPVHRHQIQPGDFYYNFNFHVRESCVEYNEPTLLLWNEADSNFASCASPSDES